MQRRQHRRWMLPCAASYLTRRIFQPSSLHMQLTSSEARMQRLKYGTSSTKTSVPLGSSWQLLQKLDAVPFSLCIMRVTTFVAGQPDDQTDAHDRKYMSHCR